jgi:hypothetical protein
MHAHDVPQSVCTCGAVLDAAANAELGVEVEPKPKDFTVCALCGQILEFDKKMVLRPVSIKRVRSVGGEAVEQAVRAAQAAVVNS